MSIHDHNPGGDLRFPSELNGTVFRLLDLGLFEWDDGERIRGPVPENVEGEPKFGKWIHVETDEGEELMAAPGELIQELQRLDCDRGDVFEVTRCEKSGGEQSDPYEVNLEALENGQARLGSE